MQSANIFLFGFRAASGRTKKDAKTNAAKATFTFLLGLSEDDLEDDNIEGKILGNLEFISLLPLLYRQTCV